MLGQHTCVPGEMLSQCHLPVLMLLAPNAAPKRLVKAKGQPANGKLLS